LTFIQGNAADTVAKKDFQDGRWGDVRAVMPLKIAGGAVAAADPEDQLSHSI
jgi:hypothetical protein